MIFELMIFKTTIKDEKTVNELRPHLDKIFWHGNWNIDLHDCDKILRIVGLRSSVKELQILADAFRISCIEMEPENIIVVDEIQMMKILRNKYQEDKMLLETSLAFIRAMYPETVYKDE